MNGSAADESAEYAAFDAATSTKAIVEAAKQYKLSGNIPDNLLSSRFSGSFLFSLFVKTKIILFVGDSFTNLCNHNAGVASRLGMFHTAETWRMLVALYSTALSYEEAGRMASKAAAARKA